MTPRPLVIYTHGAGRLGNQILRFLHWISWVRTLDDSVVLLNFAFWRYASYFSIWRDRPSCIVPLQRAAHVMDFAARTLGIAPEFILARLEGRRMPQRLLYRLASLYPNSRTFLLDDQAGEHIDLSSPRFIDEVREHRINVCAGWKFSSWKLVADHYSELRTWFQPHPQWYRATQELLAEARTKHDLIVGVLIRHTDYRQWHDGRFFYRTQEYVRWMLELLDILPSKRVLFVIACDERQDVSKFHGLPFTFAPGASNLAGHWFDSFVALSSCDLIMSPPSTFSVTAAFLGNAPLLPITHSGQTLRLDAMLQRPLLDAAQDPVFSLAVK